jgi:hypothetical protein
LIVTIVENYAERSFDRGPMVEAGGEDETVVLMARIKKHAV